MTTSAPASSSTARAARSRLGRSDGWATNISIAGSRTASPATMTPGLDPPLDGDHAIDVTGGRGAPGARDEEVARAAGRVNLIPLRAAHPAQRQPGHPFEMASVP